MKMLALVLLFAACGCAHRELLSENQVKAISQVQRWVPAGTPVADAQRIMEQHGFSCLPVTNRESSLDCDYRSTRSLWNPVLVCGHASFRLTDGKVSAVQVNTYLMGP
jgi:hypothetical protein